MGKLDEETRKKGVRFACENGQAAGGRVKVSYSCAISLTKEFVVIQLTITVAVLILHYDNRALPVLWKGRQFCAHKDQELAFGEPAVVQTRPVYFGKTADT